MSHIFHRNRGSRGLVRRQRRGGRRPHAADGLDMDRVVLPGIPADPAYCAPPPAGRPGRGSGSGGAPPPSWS
ncbi:MAG: hypothetical protein M0C28_00080 [Candidatus Moduliflexus flocculans]|nr:hypothetical protein [Candidatus Moduliflexus flocculans]